MNDEMRDAYQNIFGREWESEPILLREFDSAQQSGFKAAYQLQQTKLDKAVEALEAAEEMIGEQIGDEYGEYTQIVTALAEIKESK